MTSLLTIQTVTYSEARSDIQTVRCTVFQREQRVDPALEFDGEDDASTHLVAYLDGHPIGTTRIRYLSDRLAKIERVAVLSNYRGQGIGRQMMDHAFDHLRARGIPEVKINAQAHAKEFYSKLGFSQRGDEFDEAGIAHVEMRLVLDSVG
ncbi:MAG: GNAT family N-acetyltransferase [Elainellaceae cyanobacterium]